MPHLTLDIKSLNVQPGWQATWQLDGQSLGEPILVRESAAQAITRLGQQFLGLFEQKTRSFVAPEELRAMGRTLFRSWLEPIWPTVLSKLGPQPHDLLIRSQDRHALNLPWELVELSPGLPVGCDAAWSVRRTSLADVAPAQASLTPGPLRLLFLAAAPIDQGQLDYEREEEALLKATAQLKGDVVIRFAEVGSFQELCDLVSECRPHLVHLSGHGAVNADGRGTFAFEDERGNTDSKDAADLVAHALRGSTVRCVFVNGCETAQAAVAGLCQAIVAAGVPLSIGWSASVADDLATEFAATFYRQVVRGEPVTTAAARARAAIHRKGQIRVSGVEAQDATFALPQVYCSEWGGELYDGNAKPELYEGPRTEYTLLGDGIKGLREGYVGRRREGQLLVPALRDGDKTFAVITGIGGAGKSTLATRAANRLKTAGFRIIPVRAEATSDKGPAECARRTLEKLIEGIDQALLVEKKNDLHELLVDGKLPLRQRLRLLIDGFNDLRFALVIDNFEDVLDLDTRSIADPELSQFYAYLATHLVKGSRVLVTCRYLPANTPSLETLLHLPLPELEKHNFLKFLRRDPEVDRRMRERDLPADLLDDLYRKLGGTPGFLENVRRVLRKADPDALADDLAGLAPGALSEQAQQYYQKIFVSRLYDALAPAARDVVSRLAVSILPLPVETIAALSGLETTKAQSAIDDCVVYGFVQPFLDADWPILYHPPGLLRPWLSAEDRLAAENQQVAHADLAQFWKASYQADREKELRVPIWTELVACREHALKGTEDAIFRWATVRLANILRRRSEWQAARQMLEEIPEQGRDAELLHALAGVELDLGDWRIAREHLEQALPGCADNAPLKADTWHSLATIDLNEGNYADARDKFQKSLEIKQATGDRAGEAATWHQLASVDVNEGSYADARDKFQKSLEIKQAIGDRSGEGATWHNLATIDVYEGNYADARDNFQKSLEIEQAIGNRAGVAATWHNLATIDLNEGNYADARDNFQKTLQMRQAIGDRDGEAATWAQLAFIDSNEGSYADARDKFQKALHMLQAIGNRAGVAAIWHNFASIDLREGNHADARDKFQKSLHMLQAIGDRAGEASTFFQLGVLADKMGQGAAGARLIAISFLIHQAIGHRDAESDLESLLGICRKLGYDEDQVKEVLKEATQAYRIDRGRKLLEEAFREEKK